MATIISKITKPSATVAASLALSAGAAIAVAIVLIKIGGNKSKSGRTMSSAKDRAVAAAGEPKLPGGFVSGSFSNRRSQELYTIRLLRADLSSPPRAMAIMIHGIHDHCSRDGYVAMYQSLSSAGVDVHALDLHGHGRSDGDARGYCDRFDDYVDDASDFLEHLRSECAERGEGSPPPPLVLMGQSMGGLVACLLALRLGSSRVAGLVLTAPAAGVEMTLEMRVQNFFAPLIDACVPRSRIVDTVRPADLSRNAEAVRAYVDDPLIDCGKIVARTAIQMSRSFGDLRDRRAELTCPLLILHGTCDVVTSPKLSLDFFANVSTPAPKKRYVRIPGMYHEIYNEPERDTVIDAIVAFVSSGGTDFGDLDGEVTDGVLDMKQTSAASSR